MASEKIATVRSAKGYTYKVYWDPRNKKVYAGTTGKSYLGKASSPGHAKRIAQAYVADR